MTLKRATAARKLTKKDNPRAKRGCYRGMEKIALKDVQNLVKSTLRRAELVQQAKGLATKY